MAFPRIDIQKLVDRLHADCMEAQRGAFWWDKDQRIAVVFGNDDYSKDFRSRAEVDIVRRNLRGEGMELAFATDGFTWALACELPARLELRTLTHDIWQQWLWMTAGKHSPAWEVHHCPNPHR
jgi:hypothetical protein